MEWDGKVVIVIIIVGEVGSVTGVAISTVARRRTKYTTVAVLLNISEFGDET
jgi:hypothetical protein